MKTKLLTLLICMASGLFHALSAQIDTTKKCYDYKCLIEKAKQYADAKNFEAALNSAIAAKGYSHADETGTKVDAEADALIKDIFKKIDQLRLQAEEATEVANKAMRAAEISAKIANAERENARQSEENARQSEEKSRAQRDSVIAARAEVEELIKKGKKLQSTFPDTILTYNYLYSTGLQYFKWDKIAQSRDYQNALTYFALARFLQPSDSLDRMVFAAKTGIEAEADFINGKLAEAEVKYALIQLKMDSTAQKPGFEHWRRDQIKTVGNLFREFREKHDVLTTLVDTLEGDWWTLPIEFKQYQAISALVFRNLPVTFHQFPSVLDALPQLKSLAILHCPEVRNLKNWRNLPRLQKLILHDNANLYALDSLENINSLTFLDINNCPALTQIEGCKKLTYFAIKKSPQARVSSLLQNNPNLKKLELANLPEDYSFNSEHLNALESLNLSNMKVCDLYGLDKNALLRQLKIDRLDQLEAFNPPSHLATAYISHCDKLTGLDAWPQSDSLHKLVLFENKKLQKLPDWKRFSNLKDLLIQQNDDLSKISGTRSLNKMDRLFIINNEKLITNSIHAGFGFEWGIDLPSIKLEFEHRRTIKRLGGQNFGIKGTVVYARKKFEGDAFYTKRETKGLISGLVLTYYSPYIIYAGIGMGLGRMQSLVATQSLQTRTHFVWINNLGFQFAPPFMKKDKVGIGVDLYNIFEKNNYYILPSFGCTYYYTLGFNKKTRFMRKSDFEQLLFNRKQRTEWLEKLPYTF